MNADEFLQPSDEEVLAYESSEAGSGEYDDDDDGSEMNDRVQPLSRGRRDSLAADDDEQEEDEDEYAGWASKREDYYNADVIETEQDALEEEQEANRLQQKQLQSMTEADYGFDQDEWLDSSVAEGEDVEDDEVVREVLPQVEITEDMPEEEQLKIMRIRYPEFEPLAKDFVALQSVQEDLRLAAAAIEAVVEHVQSPKATRSRTDFQWATPTPVAVIKYQALSAYLAAISMYFVVFTSTSNDSTEPVLPMPATELRDHPIMNSLVKSRKMWEQVREIAIPDVAEVAEEAEQELPAPTPRDEPLRVNGIANNTDLGVKPVKRKKTKAQRAAEAAHAEALAREEERRRKTEEGLADLSNLLAATSARKSKAVTTKGKRQDEGDSDFGDETSLTAHESAEKAKKKKTLRFYTSQLAQKANKRDAAGRDAGGDTDLPYRERLKDRQARLNAEAEKRGNKKARDAEKLGGDSDEDDRMIARELRGEANGDDDYYDMVSAHSKKRKSDKKALADAYAEAAMAGGRVEVQEEIGPDGKRKISYAIEKNKGLTPKRKKEVRNPRVKKKKKYEEKKKKLGSIRPVYKGGEGPGGYGGELTGIKKNLVKSVKL